MSKHKFFVITIIFIIYLLIFIYEIQNIGLIWDEYDYIQSSQNHLKLLKNFFSLNTNEKKYLIEFGFQHPAFIRWIQGLFYKFIKIFNIPYANYRLGNLLFLILFFIGSYLLIIKNFNFEIFLIFLLLNILNLKFIFYFSIGSMDFPVASLYILTAGLFFSDFNNKRNQIFFIISVCLGFAAKFNYVIILIPCLIYSFLFDKKKFYVCLISIILMFFTLYLFYPFLWSSPFRHFKQYFLFHFKHFQNYEYYFHKTYNISTNFVPWHYPIIHFLFQTPEISIITGIIGSLIILKKFNKEKIFLLVICWLPLFIFFKPNSPCYNGVRLFLPTIILINIFAAFIIYKIIKSKKIKYYVIILLLIILNIFSFVKHIKYPGSYYNYFIFGTAGAEKVGLQIDIWGENLTLELVNKINQIIPDNKKIAVIGNHPNIGRYLQQINLLKKSIELNAEEEFIINDIEKFDYLVILNNKSLWTDKIFEEIKKREKIIYIKTLNGVNFSYILKIKE